MRPRLTDAESAGVGFGIDAVAAMVCGIGRRLNSKPGAAVPTVGTDICGLARGAIVSAGDSHGSIFGCCLKSVNQEQAPNSKTGSTRASLALTSHLLGTVLSQNVHRRVGAVRIGGDPDAEVAAAEAWVVADGHRQSRNPREREHGEHGGKTADQHHDLETENRVRHPARDRLAADDERPVIRYPHRNPIAERHAGESEEEREDAHLARPVSHRVLELVPRRGRVHGDVAEALFLELFDRVHRGVDLVEGSKYPLHALSPQGTSYSPVMCG